MLRRCGGYYHVTIDHATPSLHCGLLCLAHAVLRAEHVPRDAALHIDVVTAADMRDVSRRTRGVDHVTDVLTLAEAPMHTSASSALAQHVHQLLFARVDDKDNDDTGCRAGVDDTMASSQHWPPYIVRDTDTRAQRLAQLDLGSIYVCIEYMWARCHARPARNAPFVDYLHVALVHALLHAVGYRHATAHELRRMVLREQQLGMLLRAQRRRRPDTLPPLDGMEYLHHMRTGEASGDDGVRQQRQAPVRPPHARTSVVDARAASPSSPVAAVQLEVVVDDVMSRVRCLDTTQLSDAHAEAIASPYHTCTTRELLSALHARLTRTVARVPWHRPRERPAWANDLRFLGEWWLTLRSDAACTTACAALARCADAPACCRDGAETSSSDDAGDAQRLPMYRALLGDDERNSVMAQQQLVSDLARRMCGRLYHCNLLHIDELPLTPDRVHVLLYDGLLSCSMRSDTAAAASSAHPPVTAARDAALSREADGCRGDNNDDGDDTTAPACPSMRDELTTLSLSMCAIGSASLLVLLTALASSSLSSARPLHVTTLDLSHNALTERSLRCAARMLAYTTVTRLSLRGNHLASDDGACLRDFLHDGAVALEELDMAYTALTPEQVNVLVECVPLLPRLRALLLDGVTIAPATATMLARAVRRSALRCVSLHGCLPASAAAYNDLIAHACRRDDVDASAHNRNGASAATTTTSRAFFDRFFDQARVMRGAAASSLQPPSATLRVQAALPRGYRPFVSNDPSLAP